MPSTNLSWAQLGESSVPELFKGLPLGSLFAAILCPRHVTRPLLDASPSSELNPKYRVTLPGSGTYRIILSCLQEYKNTRIKKRASAVSRTYTAEAAGR